jgi:hypothetical protein
MMALKIARHIAATRSPVAAQCTCEEHRSPRLRSLPRSRRPDHHRDGAMPLSAHRHAAAGAHHARPKGWHRHVIGPRVRAQDRPVVAQPARHRERPHAVGAHVAEVIGSPGADRDRLVMPARIPRRLGRSHSRTRLVQRFQSSNQGRAST